jgi:hypothetical protein
MVVLERGYSNVDFPHESDYVGLVDIRWVRGVNTPANQGQPLHG